MRVETTINIMTMSSVTLPVLRHPDQSLIKHFKTVLLLRPPAPEVPDPCSYNSFGSDHLVSNCLRLTYSAWIYNKALYVAVSMLWCGI